MAVSLAVALAGQSLGATWSARIGLGWSYDSDLVALANGTAIATIVDCLDIGDGFCEDVVALRRSTDGGLTWGPRIKVAPRVEYALADMAAAAGRGKHVDVVWRSGNGLLYRRSHDSGQTFGRAHSVTQQGTVQEPDIARGPSGLVAISWGEWPKFTDQISVRVSDDGGQTFGPKHSWPTSQIDHSSVAVGDGVVYVAYTNAAGTAVVRRSLDAGATWSVGMRLPPVGAGYLPVVTAEGSNALVAWDGARYRRTTDRGETWSPAAFLTETPIFDMSVSLQDGVARAVFTTLDGTYYRQSMDGITWTSPQRVSALTGQASVGRAGGRVVVLYSGEKLFVKTRPV